MTGETEITVVKLERGFLVEIGEMRSAACSTFAEAVEVVADAFGDAVPFRPAPPPLWTMQAQPPNLGLQQYGPDGGGDRRIPWGAIGDQLAKYVSDDEAGEGFHISTSDARQYFMVVPAKFIRGEGDADAKHEEPELAAPAADAGAAAPVCERADEDGNPASAGADQRAGGAEVCAGAVDAGRTVAECGESAGDGGDDAAQAAPAEADGDAGEAEEAPKVAFRAGIGAAAPACAAAGETPAPASEARLKAGQETAAPLTAQEREAAIGKLSANASAVYDALCLMALTANSETVTTSNKKLAEASDVKEGSIAYVLGRLEDLRLIARSPCRNAQNGQVFTVFGALEDAQADDEVSFKRQLDADVADYAASQPEPDADAGEAKEETVLGADAWKLHAALVREADRYFDPALPFSVKPPHLAIRAGIDKQNVRGVLEDLEDAGMIEVTQLRAGAPLNVRVVRR